MNPFLELKGNAQSVKDVDRKSRIVSGYLSAFGNIDSDNDIITPGAFAKTIAERKDKIYFLFNHDWGKTLGKFNELKEDERGLYFEAEVANTSYGNDLLELYSQGIINEHSIGFNTIKADHGEKNVRIIREVKLWEGSAVTLGANSHTPFTGFKSAVKGLQDEQQKIVKAIKNGNFTDETFDQLHLALRQLMAQAYELNSTQEGAEPASTTRKVTIEPQVVSEIFSNFKI